MENGSGLGSIDKTFGLIFGVFKGYIKLCLFKFFIDIEFIIGKDWGISY